MNKEEIFNPKVHQTRVKLEERFGEFAKTILSEIQFLSEIKSASKVLFPIESGEGNKTDNVSDAGRLLEPQETLIESLKVMGREHQDLKNKISLYEQEQGSLTMNPLNHSVDQKLNEKIQRYKSSRQRSARLLRHWLQLDRDRRKMLKDHLRKDEEYNLQIKKLTDELDMALEQVAELRDELHLIGQTRTRLINQKQSEGIKKNEPQG